MADLVQSNLALEESDKAVDEIVTDAVDWAMQAPLRARFSDLPAVDIKEILQQRMFEVKSYKAHLDEARKKKRKRRKSPRTPPRSPHSHPPPPAGAYGAPQQGNKASSSSKTAASTHQSMAWTTSDTRYESTGFTAIQETSPSDDLMHDDSIPDEHVHLSDDEDSGNDHLPKDNVRKDWWKPLPEEERPATPEPAWTIPSSNVSDVKNNWASALVSTYETPAENSLLAKTGDMTTFINWYCRKVNKTVLTQADFEGQAYEVVKAFYPDVIQLQFQMEECHKMLTDQVDWTNPEGDQVRVNVNRPLPLGGPPVQNMASLTGGLINRSSILTDMILRRVEKKADFQEHTIAEKDFKKLYPNDFEDLNLLLLQGYLDHLPGSDKQILSTAVKLWTRNLVIRQRVEDLQLGIIESYQMQLNLTKPGWDATGYEFKHDYTIIESPRAFSDGTLTRILETLDYRVKEFKIKRLNPGMNTRFWTEKDVTRSKEFITAIERRLKTRRIYRNLECFVGGRVRDIDYRLLQRTE
ncbi:hypothetical protein Tco_0820663 [Tanacetum coccineum]|uniref:Uncharacterized protein n=1 Tax=Tanacetum coccineum TaxID=301880 RepID=A0ABQ5ABR4_9ASTR